jgi:hypothetical protein
MEEGCAVSCPACKGGGAWWSLLYVVRFLCFASNPKDSLHPQGLTPPLFENLGYYLLGLLRPRMFFHLLRLPALT